MNKYLEPSLLAFNKNEIINQLNECKQLKIEYIHFDIMDNNYGIGVDIQLINLVINMNFKVNVHIMSYNPIKYINHLIDLKINAITFQYEPLINNQSLDKINEYLSLIKAKQIKAGIAIDPYSKFETYQPFLNKCDFITIMSVVPGKGGQTFLNEGYLNLVKVFDYRKQFNLDYKIQIDGGINLNTINQVIDYSDYFICGSGYINLDKVNKQKLINLIQNKNR